MDESEFDETLKHVQQELSWIATWRVSYAELVRPTKSTILVLNRYTAFFIPLRNALNQAMLGAAARIIDRDVRTASIPNLIKAVRANPTLFAGSDGSAIDQLERDITGVRDIIGRLVKFRNIRLAHHDRNVDELPSIEFSEFERFMDGIEEITNDFSSEFKSSETSRLKIRRDTKRHIDDLFRDVTSGHDVFRANQLKMLEDELHSRQKEEQ